MNNAWCYRSATWMAGEIRAGRISCVELLEAHLARINDVNPRLNAVVALAAERAREEARRLDAMCARGETAGKLHGLPITIKDSLDTEGIVSTGGTVGRRAYVPCADATVVARLRAAGAIVVGKTNVPELTLGDTTDNKIYGRTNNPYDLNRSPTGSSGGAAAIIAAGGSPLDLGSDTGGSIRGPAHVCGIAGIKPTTGRVPGTGHITPPGFGAIGAFTQIGPMARYVEDLVLCLPIIAGPDQRDPNVSPVALGDPKDVSLNALRLLVYTDNGVQAPAVEIAETVVETARALERQVATVEFHCSPLLAEGTDLFVRLYQADGGASIRRLLDACGTIEPSDGLRHIIETAKPVDGARFSAILEQVASWRSRMLAMLDNYDAVLCPPLPFAAERHEATYEDRYLAWSYAMTFNLSGWPAAVVRAGTNADGLPLGVQIAAGPWCEDIVLALATAIEAYSGGFSPPESL